MNSISVTEHAAEGMIHVGSYEQAKRMLKAVDEGSLPPKRPAFTIAFSREVGAQGTAVAQEVGTRLGWPVYDHQLLEQIAQDMKLRVDLLESVDEKPSQWLRGVVEALTSTPYVSEVAFIRHLIITLRFLGAHGACVIVGRGSPHLLPADTTLRVRVVAAWDDRVTQLSRERGLSRQEAARYAETTQRERIEFIKKHFRHDPTDPQHYDLVVNTSRFSVRESAHLIIEALRQLQSHATEQASTQLS